MADRGATFSGDFLQVSMVTDIGAFVLWLVCHNPFVLLKDFLIREWSGGRFQPFQEFLIRAALAYTRFQGSAIQLEKVEKIFVKADGEIVVVLNKPLLAHPNFIEKTAEMSHATEQDFGTAWIFNRQRSYFLLGDAWNVLHVKESYRDGLLLASGRTAFTERAGLAG